MDERDYTRALNVLVTGGRTLQVPLYARAGATGAAVPAAITSRSGQPASR